MAPETDESTYDKSAYEDGMEKFERMFDDINSVRGKFMGRVTRHY